MIIGISGLRDDGSTAGAGKDEVAKILAKHDFAIIPLADEIKRTAMRWYDFTEDQLWGDKKEDPDTRYPRQHGPWVNYRCACCGVGFMDMNPPQCYLVPRFVMRWIGTEAGRTFYSDTWVRITMKAAQKVKAGAGYKRTVGVLSTNYRWRGVAIPDVRWPAGNEGAAVRAVGGELWLVRRPGTDQKGTAVAKHDSETQPVPIGVFDRVFTNDGTLALLKQNVNDAWASMERRRA